jgi:glutamate 5-kinase
MAVVKLGSSSITGLQGPDPVLLARAVAEASEAIATGSAVVLVSSGAASFGRVLLRSDAAVDVRVGRRLAAAVGQPGLMAIYKFLGDTCQRRVCQILVSEADLASQAHMLALGQLLEECATRGILPIVNGNDPADPSGCDNDLIAAALAVTCGANLLLLLTDVDGVYTRPPNAGGELLPILDHDSLRRLSLGSASAGGRGGMQSKVKAASLAAHHGVRTIIACAHHEKVLGRVLRGEAIGSMMPPLNREPLPPRLRWIGGIAAAQGCLIVNREAEASIRSGQSLFGSGVKRVRGEFERGAVVEILDPNDHLIARGLIRIASRLLRLTRALAPAEAAELLCRLLRSLSARRAGQPWTPPLAGQPLSWKGEQAIQMLRESSPSLHQTLAYEIIEMFPAAAVDSLHGGPAAVLRGLERDMMRTSLVDNGHLVVFGGRDSTRRELDGDGSDGADQGSHHLRQVSERGHAGRPSQVGSPG